MIIVKIQETFKMIRYKRRVTMDKLKKITNGYISIILCIVFTICAVIYFREIQGLSKPAGIVEAISFLLKSPDKYALCLVCGGVAKIIFAIMVIKAMASSLLLIFALRFRDDIYDEFCNKDLVWCGVNCLLAIIIGIIQVKIILDFWVLLLTIVLIGVSIWAWLSIDS